MASDLLSLWWALRDSNPQPRDYESPALTVAPRARGMKKAATEAAASKCMVEIRGFEPLTS